LACYGLLYRFFDRPSASQESPDAARDEAPEQQRAYPARFEANSGDAGRRKVS